MDHKKDKGCSMHKTLEKIQVLKKPAIKSFLSSIEDLEKGLLNKYVALLKNKERNKMKTDNN